MLRFHELPQNPVTVTYCDQTSERVMVVAVRLRKGLVRMTCDCPYYSESDWCKHCLALLCGRVILDDDQQRVAFESIVAGTRLAARAADLEETLASFSTTYLNMKHDLPIALEPQQLHNFATKAYEASIAGRQTAIAIAAFINELKPNVEQRNDEV